MAQLEKARKQHRYGLWRAAAAVPVMLAGLAVIVLLAGALGPWAPVASLSWLGVAGLWLTAAGERVAVRVAYRYRRPSVEERALLQAPLALARARTGATAGDVDLYVRRGIERSNAYAAGRRSIAVSEGLLGRLAWGQVTVPQLGALLAHEVGHLHTRATRYGLAIAWLSAPWRLVVAVLGGMLRLIVGKVPTARAGLVVLGPIVLVVAAVQGVQQHAWVPLTAMLLVGVLLIVQPLVDAALSRVGERAADVYAVACGLGPDLAEALRSFDQPGRTGGATPWASHPPRERRIHELATTGVTGVC
jgi:STE24 endopeptidase